MDPKRTGPGKHCSNAALQSYASFYSVYAERLASWGYAVVQYDTPAEPPYATVATEARSSAREIPATRAGGDGVLTFRVYESLVKALGPATR